MLFLKFFLLVFALFLTSCAVSSGGKRFSVSGVLTDYSGTPLEGGVIRLKGKGFKDLYTTHSDSQGRFLLEAPAGDYLALYAVKDYASRFLEFWYWGLILNRDLYKETKIDTLEVYGLQTWKTYGGLMIYFRPMSLLRGKAEKAKGEKFNELRLFPEMTKQDVKVLVNGHAVETRKVEEVREVVSSTGDMMKALLVNASFPKGKIHPEADWIEVCVDITDNKTQERGMACHSLKNTAWSF